MTGLWETPAGETFSFDGAHYQLADSPALPKPVQSPRPPVIIGGWGKKRTPRLAARFADEFNVPFPPARRRRRRRSTPCRAACEAAGRDPATMTLSAALVLCCGEDEDAYRRRAAAIGREPDELRTNGAGRHGGRGGREARAFADAGPSASTCRSSTCTTSTTCG